MNCVGSAHPWRTCQIPWRYEDWRAAAYERAATRPCAGFWWNTKPHMHPWIDRPENGARCQPRPDVPR